MKKVTKLPSEPEFTHKLRVAAYARVSTGKDAMLHSLTAQIDYYKTKIRANPEWIFAGVYVDEAKTGTKETREGLERLISDCRDGKIDMVLTKSISRFARNTVTLLRIVRMCKEWGVDIFFEEQSIHTMSGDGELLLGILASYVQEESRCASENQKWRIKRNFAAGMPWNGALLGYRIRDGRYEIVPEEAEIVRRIYAEYLEGLGITRSSDICARMVFPHAWEAVGERPVLPKSCKIPPTPAAFCCSAITAKIISQRKSL